MNKKIAAILIFLGMCAGQSVTASSGWTTFTPTPYDDKTYGLTELKQPGSRLIYISPAGDDTGWQH